MKLLRRMPAVCGAIGTDKFLIENSLRRAQRTGPAQGANVVFTFELLDRA